MDDQFHALLAEAERIRMASDREEHLSQLARILVHRATHGHFEETALSGTTVTEEGLAFILEVEAGVLQLIYGRKLDSFINLPAETKHVLIPKLLAKEHRGALAYYKQEIEKRAHQYLAELDSSKDPLLREAYSLN